jgi:hypothetical protein
MSVVIPDKLQTGQVRLVGIHGDDRGCYAGFVLVTSPEVQPGKVVSNSTSALSQSNNC